MDMGALFDMSETDASSAPHGESGGGSSVGEQAPSTRARGRRSVQNDKDAETFTARREELDRMMKAREQMKVM